MVATAANRKRARLSQRFRPLGWRAELHTRELHAALLRLGESADRPRAILRLTRCDCYIRDGPIPCGCTLSCARFENPFSPAVARMAAVRAALSRRQREKVPRSRQAQSVMFVSYARAIGRVINSYSQALASYFHRELDGFRGWTSPISLIHLNPRPPRRRLLPDRRRVICDPTYARRIRKTACHHAGGN
jgi:hypothetical protein